MKKGLLCLAVLALSTTSFAQPLTGGVDLAEPATMDTPQACVADCESVFADCRVLCGETTARTDEEHSRLSDLPEGKCLENCQADLDVCKRTCKESP